MNFNRPAVRMSIGLALSLAVAALLFSSQLSDTLNRKILDRQLTLLREHYPHPINRDVVIVGIDERSVNAFQEPFSLWHPHIAGFLRAMALGKPAVVGLDIPLPEYSFEPLIPQYDRALVDGLATLRARSPVVLSERTDEFGKARPVFAPLLVAAGVDGLATQTICADVDGVVRRYAPELCMVNPQRPSLEEAMAIQMGVKQGQRGLVDFSLGEKWSYVSFTTVLGWLERGDVAQLERTFGGRPVLLGVVSPLADRVRLPVPLMAGEPYNLNAPAVMLHGQVLRSMLNKGLVQEAGRGWVLVLTLLAALFWFGRVGLLKATLFLALPLFALAYSSIQLWYGLYLPVGSMLLAAVAAFMLRWAYEIVMQLRQRQAVRDIFRSYVSPQILEKILAGKIRSGLHNASKKRVCVLIADIRHFAARTEKMQPEEVIALLNDYFSEMTIAIHKHDGTLDKFIGDGLMAFFGAPLALESPEKSGLEAAQEMLVRLRLLNERLVERGVDPLEIGIGLHIGVAVIGHVGSESRHDYTALGDVVNTASRLEEMTKRLGYPVVCSEAVARVVGKAGNLADLGEQDAGQEKMRVFGWNPQVLAEPR